MLSCLLVAILLLLLLPVSATRVEAPPQLYVGGMTFGVRYMTDGILVVGYCDVGEGKQAKNPARKAGIRPGDCILSVNDKKVETASELAAVIHGSGDNALALQIRREGEEIKVQLTPVACKKDGRYRTGLWVRDSGAGIGTVTFIDRDGCHFAGLGHGICDGGSGCLVPLGKGTVMDVNLSGITRGAVGAPGELKGHFSASKTGALFLNTPCGVFGTFAEKPSSTGELLPIGTKDELHAGKATCRCTVDGEGPKEYSIEISDINKNAEGNKCFTVKITDKALLEKTGGIVQGMSGSPIMQDGKLVGAITHVLIGDPTTGYGIFVENMLANMPRALK